MENGREARKDNDLFFTCALIDYIARKTKNTRADVVNALGKSVWIRFMIWRIFTIVITLIG